MPTIFTNCDECHFHSCFGLDHKHNKRYKEDLERSNILTFLGLPKEISQKIIKLSYNLELCDYCLENPTKLCLYHTKIAKENSFHYRKNKNKKMCDQCCWWEIS